MATTGELRAIIEELQFVDIGDAASYLGEEEVCGSDALMLTQTMGLIVPLTIDSGNGTGSGNSAQ